MSYLKTAFLVLVIGSLIGCSGNKGSDDHGGGGNSNPAPSVVLIEPRAVATGGPDYLVSIYGFGFIASSTARWNGTDLATTFVNDKLVYAQVGAALRSGPGTGAITVVNPVPGGGTSNSVSTVVNTPAPAPNGVGVIQLVSATPTGAAGNGNSFTNPTVSPDGRYVAFQSDSTDLVTGGGSGFAEIFLRDTCIGVPAGCTPVTARISVAKDGGLPNGNSRGSAVSANGRFVVFDSSATNLLTGADNGRRQVYLRDNCTNVGGCTPSTILISVATDGTQGNDDSDLAVITADARFIAFASVASNLVTGDSNGLMDVFVRDTCIGAPANCTPTTKVISAPANGSASNGPSAYPWFSADGRYISYSTSATNLTNNGSAVVLRDTCWGAVVTCTPTTDGIFIGYAGDRVQGAADVPWILSANGRFSGFGAQARNLVPGDTGQAVGAFMFDSCIGASGTCIQHTIKASQTYNGGVADSGSGAAAVSDDGNYVVFTSVSSNLLPFSYISKAVYVRRTCYTGESGCIPTTYLLSQDGSSGVQGNSSDSEFPMITPDARYAVFISNAPNWTGSLHSNGLNQVWLARVR